LDDAARWCAKQQGSHCGTLRAVKVSRRIHLREIGTEGKSNKFVDYLENARGLLNQSSFEYRNSNYTGAEELAIAAYLDNFEHVEEELEKKSSHAFMEDIEHKMREELRDLIKDKAQQSELDIHINATDAKLVEAINLLKGDN